MRRIWTTALILLLVIPSICLAQSPPKFGCIDTDKVLKNWKEFQVIGDTLKTDYDEKRSFLLQKQKKIQDEIEDFETKKVLLPAETIKTRTIELETLRDNFQKQFMAESQDFQKKRDAALKQLEEKLKETVEKICKEQEYAFVFRKKSLYYSDPKYDISDLVLARINETK